MAVGLLQVLHEKGIHAAGEVALAVWECGPRQQPVETPADVRPADGHGNSCRRLGQSVFDAGYGHLLVSDVDNAGAAHAGTKSGTYGLLRGQDTLILNFYN